MTDNVFCYLLDMPYSIKSTVTIDNDGNYVVYINSRHCREQQIRGYEHELTHINNNDLYKYGSVSTIELEAHGVD